MQPTLSILRLLACALCGVTLVTAGCRDRQRGSSARAPAPSTQSRGEKQLSQEAHVAAASKEMPSECAVLARFPGPAPSLHWSSTATRSTVGYLQTAGQRLDIVEHPAERHMQPPYTHCGPLNDRHEPVPQMLDPDCGQGRACLRFEGFAHPAEGCPSDRLELVLSHGDRDDALRFGETRHLRFALKVTPETVDPEQRVLISQIWQHQYLKDGPLHDVGPPFFIAVGHHPDPKLVRLDFAYRSDFSQDAVTFLREELELDEWAVFHLRLRPSFQGAEGSILVWRDLGRGELHFTESEALNYDPDSTKNSRFYWGYTPSPTTRIGSVFSIRIGMYRPAPTQRFGVWFDHVQLGVVHEEQPHSVSQCWKLDEVLPADE